ncbi:MAG: DUF4870 domain-containing protein [Chitinophaga sp.]|uniref:DUF4870 domain-containing protein n=1 Tax=Chitinophaga sp. TaxID=1869181 RepID=UPI001B057E04|nr:DUF4870 domain-containing protein [Chitinophaga sp.]MBO9730948.1 DUF4870 domain-containing protein [Chitinophaga sp.]
MNQKDEYTWGTLVHLGGLIGTAISPTVGNIIGVLILWLIKRNESTFVDNQGKEAINFQITLSIAAVLVKLVDNITSGLWVMANFWRRTHWDFDTVWTWSGLLGVIWVVNIIFSVVAAVKANKGESYKYPLSLHLVK